MGGNSIRDGERMPLVLSGDKILMLHGSRKCETGKLKYLNVKGVSTEENKHGLIMVPTIYISLLGCVENAIIRENKLSLQITGFSSFSLTDPNKTISPMKTGLFLLQNLNNEGNKL